MPFARRRHVAPTHCSTHNACSACVFYLLPLAKNYGRRIRFEKQKSVWERSRGRHTNCASSKFMIAIRNFEAPTKGERSSREKERAPANASFASGADGDSKLLKEAGRQQTGAAKQSERKDAMRLPKRIHNPSDRSGRHPRIYPSLFLYFFDRRRILM